MDHSLFLNWNVISLQHFLVFYGVFIFPPKFCFLGHWYCCAHQIVIFSSSLSIVLLYSLDCSSYLLLSEFSSNESSSKYWLNWFFLCSSFPFNPVGVLWIFIYLGFLKAYIIFKWCYYNTFVWFCSIWYCRIIVNLIMGIAVIVHLIHWMVLHCL